MTLKVGDVVGLKRKSRRNGFFKENKDNIWNQVPWLSVDPEKMQGKVIAEPERENIDYPIEETQIVELYSK